MSIYRFEIRRMFRTSGFYLSLLIGTAIAVLDWITNSLQSSLDLDLYMSQSKLMVYPFSAFLTWIGGNNSKYATIYFLILPLLVAFPFAITFYTDCKSHYINFLCTRTSQKSYFTAKFVSTFLSGGVISVIPLVINFILSTLVLPCVKIQAVSNGFLLPKSSFSSLYYQYPVIYMVISLSMIFVFGGTLAVTALYVTFYSKWIFSVMLFPFILTLVIMSVADLFEKYAWEPMQFLNPACSDPRFCAFLIETLILFLIAIVEFLIIGRKQDILM